MSPTETDPVMATPTGPAPTPAPSAWMSRLGAHLLRRMLLVTGLLALVMIGLLLTNLSHLSARFYWSAMFPIFGLVSIWHELVGKHPYEGPVWKLILIQTLHWIGPIVAVRIIFLQLARGQMAADEVALMTLLVLAVTCFLAGVHMDYSFYWISVVLALAAVFGTEIEAYIWILAVIAVIAVAIAVLAGAALRQSGTARAPS
jgi:hypothetical protein